MNTLTGAVLGGLLGATNIKVGDLSKNQKIAILALAGAVIVNLHKELYKNPINQPTPAIEAYKFKDSKRA
jgi:hypothetical protein